MIDLFGLISDRIGLGQATALATVITTEGSTPVKVGARAVYDGAGIRVAGWTGGGCIDGAIGEAAREAIGTESSRTLELDLSDEIRGVGLPCGGKMTLLVESVGPRPLLEVVGRGPVVDALLRFGALLGNEVRLHGTGPASAEEADPSTPSTTILDADPDFQRLAERPRAAVVVASSHKGDERAVARALEKRAAYVGLVASRSRGAMVLERAADLLGPDGPSAVSAVHTPAGLDIGASTPEEIALAIVAEIVSVRRGSNRT